MVQDLALSHASRGRRGVTPSVPLSSAPGGPECCLRKSTIGASFFGVPYLGAPALNGLAALGYKDQLALLPWWLDPKASVLISRMAVLPPDVATVAALLRPGRTTLVR